MGAVAAVAGHELALLPAQLGLPNFAVFSGFVTHRDSYHSQF